MAKSTKKGDSFHCRMDAAQFAQFMERLGGGRKCPETSSTDADEWRTYRARFEATVTLNRWTARRARSELMVAISGQLATLLRDLVFVPPGSIPDPDDCPGVADLLNQIERRLMPPADSDMTRISIRQAKQGAEETLQAWQGRIRQLYRRGHPEIEVGDLETHRPLVDSFILGLSDPYMQRQVWERRPANLQEATDIATNVEAGNMVLPASREVHAIGGGGLTTSEVCWFCSKPGHQMKDCHTMMKFRKEYLQSRDPKRLSGGGGGRGRGGGFRGRGGGRGGGSGARKPPGKPSWPSKKKDSKFRGSSGAYNVGSVGESGESEANPQGDGEAEASEDTAGDAFDFNKWADQLSGNGEGRSSS